MGGSDIKFKIINYYRIALKGKNVAALIVISRDLHWNKQRSYKLLTTVN